MPEVQGEGHGTHISELQVPYLGLGLEVVSPFISQGDSRGKQFLALILRSTGPGSQVGTLQGHCRLSEGPHVWLLPS